MNVALSPALQLSPASSPSTRSTARPKRTVTSVPDWVPTTVNVPRKSFGERCPASPRVARVCGQPSTVVRVPSAEVGSSSEASFEYTSACASGLNW